MNDADGVVETHTTQQFKENSGHAVIVCGIGRDETGKKRYVYRDPGHAGHYRSKPVKAFPAEVSAIDEEEREFSAGREQNARRKAG